MKVFLVFVLLGLQLTLNAQLDKDGKSVTINAKPEQESYGASIISFSGSTMAPFGLKYQYSKSSGGYIWFKSDFDIRENRNQITLGLTKSLSDLFNIYLGGGIQVGEYFDEKKYIIRKDICPLFEGGILIKVKGVSIEIGFGIVEETFKEESGLIFDYFTQPFISYGLGYLF